MTRSITFNGVTRFVPGGITRVSSDVLDNVGLAATGVVGLIGEADAGEGGATAGLISFRDPSRAIQTYKSGPLVDAIRLAFQSSADPLIPGGAQEVVVYKVNASTKSSVNLPSDTVASHSDTANTGSTTTSIALTTGALTASAYIGYWVDVTLSALPGAPKYRRMITANTTNALTVTPALPAAPASGNVVTILANIISLQSKGYGVSTAGITAELVYDGSKYQIIINNAGVTETSPTLGGTNYLSVLYRGGALSVTADTFAAAGSTAATINITSGGLVASAHVGKTVVIVPNTSAPAPIYRRISANTASSITFSVPLTAAEFASLTGASSTVSILNVTNATAAITGSKGAATAFATTITGVSGDDLSISINSTMTLNDLIKAINTNPNYYAVAGAGINGDVVLAKDFDFGVTAINIQTSVEDATAWFSQNVNDVIKWFNNYSVNATATRAAGFTTDGEFLPTTVGDAYSIAPYTFPLSGGTRGTSTNANWQAGFDALLTRPMNLVVPLIDQDLVNEGYGSTATWASVSQQLVSHVALGRGSAGLERGAFIGVIGTKSAYIAACNSLNDEDVQCVSQSPTILSASGTLIQSTPRMLAVMGASMRAGVSDLGEPLTNKYIRASGITQDASWDPADLTDSADLVIAGALFAVTVPGKGIRWVRDLTTWVKNDDLCYTEGSIRSTIREISYNLRVVLVDRFTGRRALPATIANVKNVATTVFEDYRTDGAIVDSTDPVTGQVTKAYHNLKVYSTGDVMRVAAGIFPVPGINFILNDIYVQVPSQSA